MYFSMNFFIVRQQYLTRRGDCKLKRGFKCADLLCIQHVHLTVYIFLKRDLNWSGWLAQLLQVPLDQFPLHMPVSETDIECRTSRDILTVLLENDGMVLSLTLKRGCGYQDPESNS